MLITLLDHSMTALLAGMLAPHRRPAAVAMGTFDGVHAGHRRVIDRTRQLADQHGLAAVAVTFDPRPERHFRGQSALPDLVSVSERVRLLHSHGIDDVVVLPFNDELARVCPEAFLDVLIGELDMRALCVGEGFRFGAGGAGHIEMVRARGLVAVSVPTVIDPTTAERISSTALRRKRAESST